MALAIRFALLAAALFAGSAGQDSSSAVEMAEFAGTLDALEESVSDMKLNDEGLVRLLSEGNGTEEVTTTTVEATTTTVETPDETPDQNTTENTTAGTTPTPTTDADTTTTVAGDGTTIDGTTTLDGTDTPATTTTPAIADAGGAFPQASVSAGLCALIAAAFLAKQL